MDVIASGAEACPWGLNGYGFDPYIAATPGNVVAALANFWADNVRATLAAEEHFPDKCFRLRYEDIVSEPEAMATALFEFLGVSPAPGISLACFSSDRERFGPGDHKIWYTSEINTDSVGRGWSVPSVMIAPPLLNMINELAGKLGYLAVDDSWGTTEPPADLRVAVSATADEADSESSGSDASAEHDVRTTGNGTAISTKRRVASAIAGVPFKSERLGAALREGMKATSGGGFFSGDRETETFVAVAITGGAEHSAEYWLVDLAHETVTPADKDAQEDSDWDLIGTVEIWERVITRQVNLSAALRSCQLRYCDSDQALDLIVQARLSVVGRLLGLANWQ